MELRRTEDELRSRALDLVTTPTDEADRLPGDRILRRSHRVGPRCCPDRHDLHPRRRSNRISEPRRHGFWGVGTPRRDLGHDVSWPRSPLPVQGPYKCADYRHSAEQTPTP